MNENSKSISVYMGVKGNRMCYFLRHPKVNAGHAIPCDPKDLDKKMTVMFGYIRLIGAR